MGSGVSRPKCGKDIVLPTTIFCNGKQVGVKKQRRNLYLSGGFLKLYEGDNVDSLALDIDLDRELTVSHENINDDIVFTIRVGDDVLQVYFTSNTHLHQWTDILNEEISVAKAKLISDNTRGLDRVMSMISTLPQSDSIEPATSFDSHFVANAEGEQAFETLPAPIMKIAILVVGTRGDVQPFINIGLALKDLGHDVRVATHGEYRADVMKEGLKYYPLAGDPRKLSEYMVKTGGRLLPDLLNEEERTVLPEKMQMLKDITYSTWPACTQADPEDSTQEPFVAEAIISNPVSYGHVHCAEALAIPLPWYPTKAFPHPLSNLSFEEPWSSKNRLSFRLVDEFMWLGLGNIVNDFRKKVLHLPPIRFGESGESLLVDLEVPISHMWSPSFVPRCVDWPAHVDVVGDFTRAPPRQGEDSENAEHPTSFNPDARLVAFLEECGEEKPIYIGFGSMVIGDSESLVNIIKEASSATGYRVVLQSGWTKYADEYERITDRIMVIGAMSHDWLFKQVSATIHHGGAGTTSAALRADNPTFICPFFGDQHFWAEMVFRAGAGPKGCPIGSLTSDILIKAFHVLESAETKQNVRVLSAKMNSENGVEKGIASFLRNLPLEDMLCEVSLFRKKSDIAKVFCQSCGLKMSCAVDAVVHRIGGGRSRHVRMPYRCVKYGPDPPSGLLDGLGHGLGAAAYEFAGGFYDLIAKPIEGAREGGVEGAALGMARGFVGLIARPIKGGGILIDKVSTSLRSDRGRRRNRTVEETVKAGGGSRFRLNFTCEGNQSDQRDEVRTDSNDYLSQDDQATEHALEKALAFQKFWISLDTSGDRFVSLAELERVMPAHEADALLQMADKNQDGELTFAELASNIIAHGHRVNSQKEG